MSGIQDTTYLFVRCGTNELGGERAEEQELELQGKDERLPRSPSPPTNSLTFYGNYLITGLLPVGYT